MIPVKHLNFFKLRFLKALETFYGLNGFLFWSASYKFNQSSGASGIEVTHLLETANACNSNPVGACFLAVFVIFVTIVRRVMFIDLVPVTQFFLKAELSSELL